MSDFSISNYNGIFTTVANDIWFQITNSDIPLGIAPGLSQSGYKFLAQVINLDKLTAADYEYLGNYSFVPDRDGNSYFSVKTILDTIVRNNQNDSEYNLDINIGLYPIYYYDIISPDINGYSRYALRIGNVWNPQLQFTSNFDYGGNIGLSFSTPHYLQVYDEITINTYDPTTLVGQKIVTDVVSVIDNYSIEINEPYSLGYIYTGTIVYAKNFSYSSVSFYTYNGAINYGQENINPLSGGVFGGWVDDNLVFTFDTGDYSTSGQFLTPFGGTSSQHPKKVLINDYETLTFLLPNDWFLYYSDFVYVITNYDNNWVTQSSYSYPVVFTEINSLEELSGYNKFTIGSGPVNLYDNIIFPILPPPTNYYSVDLQFTATYGGTFSASTGPYYYEIETDCSPFENVRLVWINRLGGYDCFNFRMNSKRNESIKRKEYKSILKPLYKTGDREDTTITVETDEVWTINSNWVTEQEYIALNDLITSIDVSLVVYSDTTPSYPVVYPITIVDNSYTQKTQLTEKLFNMTVKYKIAYEKYIQYR